jgi:hypothetical protein
MRQGAWFLTSFPILGEGSIAELYQGIDGLAPATGYHWRLRAASTSPYFPHTKWMAIAPSVPSLKQFRTADAADDVGDAAGQISDLRIDAFPNPFHDGTTIRYALPRADEVRVSIHDVSGRLVRTLAAGQKAAGTHRVGWDGTGADGRRVASGVYWIRLNCGEEEIARDILLAQ